MKNTRKMMDVCRRTASSVAGVDSDTMAAVVEMRMRSENTDTDTQTINAVSEAVIEECNAAKNDFSL